MFQSQIKDERGNRHGRLYVVEYAHNDKHHKACWICKCDCGNTVIVSGHKLRNGNTKSCGCYKHDTCVKRNTIHTELPVDEIVRLRITGMSLKNIGKAYGCSQGTIQKLLIKEKGTCSWVELKKKA